MVIVAEEEKVVNNIRVLPMVMRTESHTELFDFVHLRSTKNR